MHITWTNDAARRLIRVRVPEGAAEQDYLVAVRDIATVTNMSGGYAILFDLREVSDLPDFSSVMRVVRVIETMQSPQPDHLAIVATPTGAVYGKGRQIVSVLSQMGVSTELFSDTAEAMSWLAEKQPLVAGGGSAA